MKFQISNFPEKIAKQFFGTSKFQIQGGYTLVELMVVLGIIGAISMMTLYGLKASNSSQSVDNAQKEFVSNLHAVQNRVDSGEVIGDKVVQEIDIPASGTTYSINTTKIITLPSGVTMTNKIGAVSGAITLCFSDRNLDNFDATNTCNQCKDPTDIGYVCVGSNASSPSSVVVTFTSGNVSKTVTIKGSGMRITEINSL